MQESFMKKQLIKWLWRVTGNEKGYVFALLAVQSLHGFSGVIFALLLRNVVDAAAERNSNDFFRALAEIILLALAQVILRMLVRWISEMARSGFENRFKKCLIKSLLQGDCLQVEGVHSGEWMNRLTNDCTVVGNGCAEILPGMAETGVKLIGALTMLFILEPRFMIILIPGAIVTGVLTRLLRSKMKQMHKSVQEADGEFRSFIQERLLCLITLHAFSSELRTVEEADVFMDQHRKRRLRRTGFSNLCNAVFQAAMSATYLAGIGMCGYGILTGTITFGTMTAVAQLVTQIQAPLANMTGYLPRWYAVIASAERIREPEAFKMTYNYSAADAGNLRNTCNNNFLSIGFRNAIFSYDEERKVLNGASLNISKGEFIALVGPSGGGKSTILKILSCVFSLNEGARYYVDDAGSECPVDVSWRSLFAYVPQGNCLISGRVREVICYADPKAGNDEDRIEQALAVSCSKEFISALPDGVDTMLGEGGAGLSEGQMQRLAIARALFSERPILLLDEATSALDEETERRFLENLRALKDRTVVIVTHRPAALAICDRVFRVSGGEIWEI